MTPGDLRLPAVATIRQFQTLGHPCDSPVVTHESFVETFEVLQCLAPIVLWRRNIRVNLDCDLSLRIGELASLEVDQAARWVASKWLESIVRTDREMCSASASCLHS